MSETPTEPEDEPVPKLPYGRGLKLDRAMVFRIGTTLILLIMIVVAARPCANATSKFVTDFDDKGSASQTMPKPGNVDQGQEYEVISPNMTDEERKAAIERAKAKGRGGAGSAETGSAGSGTGSAASGSAASGSASSGSAASGSAH